MKILLPQPIVQRLANELRRARRREIGGLLMGEHLLGETFRIAEVSVQRSGGSSAHFIRDPAEHRAQLAEFFQRNGGDYTRFNYMGEWHSHPSFEPLPSITDLMTMQSIVDDPEVGANFLVLLILTSKRRKGMEVSATGFRRGGEPFAVSIEAERKESRARESIFCRLGRLLRF
jgi:integrative and conjugative element protein (TIGR02256 family)